MLPLPGESSRDAQPHWAEAHPLLWTRRGVAAQGRRELEGGVVVSSEHHIWCNFFMRSREGCKMCDEAFKLYPMEGLTPDELLTKHFPNVVKREGT